MKIYVASSILNKKKVQKVQQKLTNLGHTITFDWTKDEAINKEASVVCAFNDLGGVFTADCIVILAPGRIGTFTEFGYALGLGRPVILVGFDANDCPFFLLPSVQRINRIKDLNCALESLDL